MFISHFKIFTSWKCLRLFYRHGTKINCLEKPTFAPHGFRKCI